MTAALSLPTGRSRWKVRATCSSVGYIQNTPINPRIRAAARPDRTRRRVTTRYPFPTLPTDPYHQPPRHPVGTLRHRRLRLRNRLVPNSFPLSEVAACLLLGLG